MASLVICLLLCLYASMMTASSNIRASNGGCRHKLVSKDVLHCSTAVVQDHLDIRASNGSCRHKLVSKDVLHCSTAVVQDHLDNILCCIVGSMQIFKGSLY